MSSSPAIARLRSTLLALVCAGIALWAAHVVMGRLAVWAETEEGAYLWWREEMMQLFSPTNYVGRGEGRILVTGPSEIREAILPELMSERLGRDVYQNAISLGTLQTVVLQLEYIERYFGVSAVPDVVVLGVTPRFVSEAPPLAEAPFRDYVERFSPYAVIDTERVALEDKGVLPSLVARARHLAHQPRRYKGALRALRKRLGGPDDFMLRPAKFHHYGALPKAAYFEMAARDGRIPWSLDEDEPAILRDFARLVALCNRHDVELFVVVMPEGSWARSDLHYPPGYHEKFLRLIRKASGVQPLDLRSALRDGEFFDWAHPTAAGARKVTRRVCRHIMKTSKLDGR